MPKVTFVNDSIMMGSVRIGNLSGSRETIYVTISTATGSQVVARFKYKSPKANAKDWVKFILNHYTPEQLIQALKDTTPLELAKKHGYESLNVRKYLKEQAAWRKDMASYLMVYEARPARFNETSCSQCGRTFGPGNHGFSDCSHHKYL